MRMPSSYYTTESSDIFATEQSSIGRLSSTSYIWHHRAVLIATALIAALMLSFASNPARAQQVKLTWQWLRTAGHQNDDAGNAVAADKNGFTYVTGFFQGPAKFSGGGIERVFPAGTGKNAFIAKFDTDGKLIWVARGSGTAQEEGRGIDVDDGGNVYVTGYYTGNATFYNESQNEGAGKTLNAINGGDANSRDIFIVKYDKDGKILQARRAGGTGMDEGASIVVEKKVAEDQRLWVAGYITGEGAFNFDDATPTKLKADGGGAKDIFAIRYKASNVDAEIWGGAFGAAADDEAFGIAVNFADFNRVYVTGYFNGKVKFNANKQLEATAGADAFILMLTSQVTVAEVRKAGGEGNESGRGVAVNSTVPDAAPVVTGLYSSPEIRFFKPGNDLKAKHYEGAAPQLNDAFTVQYNKKLEAVWVTTVNGPGNDQGHGVAVDEKGDVYVAGFYSATVDLRSWFIYGSGYKEKPYLGFSSHNGAGRANSFVLKYNGKNGGRPADARDIYIPTPAKDGDNVATGVALAGVNAIAITGLFTSPKVSFGKHTATNAMAGKQDFYLAVLSAKNGKLALQRALEFDGDLSYCDAGLPIFNGLEEFTIEAWIRPSSLQGTQSIAGQYGAVEMYLSGSTLVLRTSNGGTDSIPLNIPPETWHHIAGVGTGDSLKLYVDGLLMSAHQVVASGGSYGSSPYAASIGGNVAIPGGSPFNGVIDEVRFWEIARDLSELRRTRHITLYGSEYGLLGYWGMGEGDGDSVYDASPNSLTMLRINGPQWVYSTAPVGFGFSDTQLLISSDIDLSGADMTMTITQSGSPDTLVASHIYEPPNLIPHTYSSMSTDYWVVNRYGSTMPLDADVSFMLLPEHVIGVLDAATASNLKLFERDDNSDGLWSLPIQNGSSVDMATKSITFTGITDFSQFIIGTMGDSRLPVELRDLFLSAANFNVRVDWSTASETNNLGFEVQRATGEDGVFMPVASYMTHPDLAGLGTSNIGRQYRLEDAVPGPGLYRYRLVDISSDGIRTVHAERYIDIENTALNINLLRLDRVRPNPASDRLQIGYRLPEEMAVTMGIYSVTGELIAVIVDMAERGGGNHVESFSVSDLEPGVYMVRLTAGITSRIQRFVVVR